MQRPTPARGSVALMVHHVKNEPTPKEALLPKLIPDFGPRGAKLVIIGEAPGQREHEAGRPFVGPAGHLLDSWMLTSGINRESVYYTNVVPYWPGEWTHGQSNNFAAIPRDVVLAAIEPLHERIASLDDPIVISPTGNRALRALFRGDPFDDKRGMKISDYRGSILCYQGHSGRSTKVIPTIHPAATFRRPILTKFCLADWKRIAGDLQFRELRIPKREHHLIDEVVFDRLMDWDGPLAVDIECEIGTGKIQCVAFSHQPEWSGTIPIWYKGDAYSKQCWDWLHDLCGNPAPKVLQNGLFDQFILAKNDVQLNNYTWDTLEMSHALDPNDGSDPQAQEEAPEDDIRLSMHSLAVLTSLYTRTPYYKGDARDGFKMGWSRLEDLWNYCGLDACVTIEIFYILKQRLEMEGLL